MKILSLFLSIPCLCFANYTSDLDCCFLYLNNPKSYAQYCIGNLDSVIKHYENDYVINKNHHCFIKECKASKAAYEDMIIAIDHFAQKDSASY